MAIRNVVVEGDEILRKKCREVTEVNDRIRMTMQDMLETMRDSMGVGIAAPQVGLAIRLLIVDGAPFGEDDPELAAFRRVMINPVLLEESEETADYNEGCLSVPDIHADITRPAKIKVKYLNGNGEEVTEELDGFKCRMVQHEIDHLNGKMFVDRATPIRKKMIAAKLNKITEGKVRTHYKVARPLKKK